MNKITRIGVALAIAIIPNITFAAKTLSDLMTSVATYLNKGLLLLMGLAVLMFVWFVIKYFIRASDTDRTEGSKYLMWSVIGFFVILSFWGFVNILQNTFGLDYAKPNTWSDIFPGSTGTASSN